MSRQRLLNRRFIMACARGDGEAVLDLLEQGATELGVGAQAAELNGHRELYAMVIEAAAACGLPPPEEKKEAPAPEEKEVTAHADGKRWAEARHVLADRRVLTEGDPRAPDPPGFKGHLTAPQATLLQAMLDLEARPLLAIGDRGDAGGAGVGAGSLQTSRALVAEKFSFGKTVLAMALVCASRCPRALPFAAHALLRNCEHDACDIVAAVATRLAPASGAEQFSLRPSAAVFAPELVCLFPRALRLTVVVAASSIITQWCDRLREFTSLRYLVIDNVKTLREFEDKLRSGDVDRSTDVLLIKQGRVTSAFRVDGERRPADDEKGRTTRSLLEAFSVVIEGLTLARLIVDDYDTLPLHADDRFPPALFTWLISATRRACAVRRRAEPTPRTVAEALRRARAISVRGTALDDVLYGALSLKCDPVFVARHMRVLEPQYRRVRVRGGQAAAALRALGVTDRVIEMVNGDAVGAAAADLGVVASSAGDLLARVLDDRKGKYREAVEALRLVALARAAVAAMPAVRWAATHDDAERAEAVKRLAEAVRARREAAVRAALADVRPDKAVDRALDALERAAAQAKTDVGKALERMRDNIRENLCQCCKVSFSDAATAGDDSSAYIINCCQVVLCSGCITEEHQVTQRRFVQRCPNCATHQGAKPSFIRVGAEIDLNTVLSDDALLAEAAPAAGDEKSPGPAPEAPEVDASPQADEKDRDLSELNFNPRLKALVQVLLGQATEGAIADEYAQINIPNLLTASLAADGGGERVIVPRPAGVPAKFLVFATHDVSLGQIGATLTRFGVGHRLLQGTRKAKDRALAEFREDPRVPVLLVGALHQSSGMDLPWVSHIVLYHRIIDEALRSQAIGRVQRLGRAFSATIVEILNESERD